jgi:hypothetical protein
VGLTSNYPRSGRILLSLLEMDISESSGLTVPMSVEAGFALFDLYFSELRYLQELRELGGVGSVERFVLS